MRRGALAQAIPHATVITVEGDHAVCLSDPARFSAKLLEACLPPRRESFHRVGPPFDDNCPAGPEPLQMPADDVLHPGQRFGIGGNRAQGEPIRARNYGRSPVGEDQPAPEWLPFDLLNRNLVAQVGQ
jgi:hypothetical protein